MAENKKKIVIIVQARMGSTRLPGKVLMDISGYPVLWHMINRLKHSKLANKIVIATSTDKKDDAIEQFCKKYNLDFYRGSEEDVLDRYYQAAKIYGADVITRISADCPLIDPEIVDDIIAHYINGPALDYIHTGGTYPEGAGIEVFSSAALEKAWKQARLKSEREHVTPFIWKNNNIFKIKCIEMKEDNSHIRITLDESADFEVLKAIFKHFSYSKRPFNLQNIIGFIKENKDIYNLNKHILRRAGYQKSLREDSKL